jgi:hypothetical protein
LQELLAPRQLCFVAKDWETELGTKITLREQISDITGVETTYLQYVDALGVASVATRMFWASQRRCTRQEDTAYCLFGLFNVQMPRLYGEGLSKAFLRLQFEVIKMSNDESIFSWSGVDPSMQTLGGQLVGGLLATSPGLFRSSRTVERRVFDHVGIWYHVLGTIAKDPYSSLHIGVLPPSIVTILTRVFHLYPQFNTRSCYFDDKDVLDETDGRFHQWKPRLEFYWIKPNTKLLFT